MAQFGTTGKNPPWVRTAATAAALGQPTQLTSPLLVQATIGAPGVTSAQAGAAPVTLQQQQSQQQAVAQQATTYNAASLTALGLAQVGMEQSRENVFLVQNAALQPGTVISQPGVALPASLTAAPVGTPGLALPTTLATTPVATVSYPAPRVLQHPTQFQQAAPQPQPQPHAPKQRVFTGTVNKLHENFGFVDDDVFFQTNCIKGAMPKVGDRVLVEASYNPNMPFKWNAARIQVLPNQTQVQVQNQQPPPQQQQALVRPGLIPSNAAGPVMTPSGVPPQITLAIAQQPGPAMAPTMALPPQLTQQAPPYSQVPPPAIHSMGPCPTPVNRLPSLMGTRRHSPPPLRREREREIRRDERRERERHREREHERERERTSVVRKRSRSPRPRSRSPPRRRPRVVPRYVVQIPKISLDMKEANVMELRKRYSNMYVPSDFFFSSFVWMDAFPLRRPFTLERPCAFHIMNKEVDPINENDAILEPPDSDHTFTCKVMLLASPPLEDIYHKSCALADDPLEAKENFVHPTRLISFLVGLKSKNETMAIGGPWSPSLDGPNPDKDPTVLIKTAIRTCRALTGIDLSPCTKWYRFAEVYYHRGETTHKGRVVPARVETVVLFLPDVWSCTPTRKEWLNMAANYKKQLQKKLHEEAPEANENQQAVSEDVPKDPQKKDPSHHSELEPKSMKITDLRRELEVRNLSCKGLKSQLVARLSKALKAEHDKEEEEAEGHPEDAEADDEDKMDADDKDDDKKKKEDEEKKKEEKEKAVRERRYTLPDTPSIIVHPSRTAKGGKFDCTVMSLSVLLDYRQEDNKEYSFEVSLFAELFNEMLMRDFGFWIYRALAEIPEKKESDEKEKKKEKDKKDEKKDDKDEGDAKKETVDSKKERRKKDEEEKEGDDENEEDEYEDEEIEDEEEEDRKDKKKDDKKIDKEKKQEKAKLYTANPGLLLAFVYFDQNHCGYLLDKDLEEILYTLGLNLSRAQVRKLLQNAVLKDKLHYRKLTDKPKSKEDTDKSKLLEDKNDKELGQEWVDRLLVNLEELALGNNGLLSAVKYTGNSSENLMADKGPPDVSSTGLVMYNGALLDIAKLLQQMQRGEKARTDTEQKLKCLQEELGEVKEAAATTEQTSQKLSIELRDYKRRLRTSEDELKVQQENAHKFREAIKTCHDVLRPMIQLGDDSANSVSTTRFDRISPESSKATGSVTPEVNSKKVCENGEV